MGHTAISIVFRGGATLKIWGTESEMGKFREILKRSQGELTDGPVLELSHSGGEGSLTLKCGEVAAVSFLEK